MQTAKCRKPQGVVNGTTEQGNPAYCTRATDTAQKLVGLLRSLVLSDWGESQMHANAEARLNITQHPLFKTRYINPCAKAYSWGSGTLTTPEPRRTEPGPHREKLSNLE